MGDACTRNSLVLSLVGGTADSIAKWWIICNPEFHVKNMNSEIKKSPVFTGLLLLSSLGWNVAD
jgi:hypothetical protein